MSIAEGAILKIAAHTLLPDTQTAINVFWAELLDNVGAGPLDEQDVLDAAANWIDLMWDNLLGDISDTVSSPLCEVWIVDEPTGDLTPVGDNALTWVPTNANDVFPNGVAAICALKTTETDVTGRKFIAGFSDTKAIDNNLSVGAVADLAEFGIDWAANYVDANDVEFNSGVYSGTKSAFYPSSGTIVANAIVGYQRRRKPGVGS